MFENNVDSEIDKKKKEVEKIKQIDTPWESVMSLLKITFIFVFLVILLVLTGSFYLFTAKVGQSNILPTDKNCMPYSGNPPEIQPIDINANITDVNGIRESQKINFDYKENSKNVFLDFLKNITDYPFQSGTTMYFTTILQDVMCLNYQMFNSVYNFVNSVFSESLTLFLLPLIALFVVPIILLVFFLVNYIYFYYSWFAKLPWFFKKNTNKDIKLKPNWSDIGLTSEPVSYIISLMLSFTMVGLLLFSFLIPIPILGSILGLILMYACFTPLFVVGKKAGTKEDYTFFSSIIENFRYNRGTIMGIMTFFIILTSFSSIGWIGGLFSILTFLLFYFEYMPLKIYDSPIPEVLSPLALFEQAKKECKFTSLEETNPGILSKISKFLRLSGGDMKGGCNLDFDKSIKTIGKIMKNATSL